MNAENSGDHVTRSILNLFRLRKYLNLGVANSFAYIFWISKSQCQLSCCDSHYVDVAFTFIHATLIGYVLYTVLTHAKLRDTPAKILALFNDVHTYFFFLWKFESYIWIYSCDSLKEFQSVEMNCFRGQHLALTIVSSFAVPIDLFLSFVITLKAEESMAGVHHLSK